MNIRKITIKKWNSKIYNKIAIRLVACENLEKIKVLDCYHGKGKLWSILGDFINIDELLGIEKIKL